MNKWWTIIKDQTIKQILLLFTLSLVNCQTAVGSATESEDDYKLLPIKAGKYTLIVNYAKQLLGKEEFDKALDKKLRESQFELTLEEYKILPEKIQNDIYEVAIRGITIKPLEHKSDEYDLTTVRPGANLKLPLEQIGIDCEVANYGITSEAQINCVDRVTKLQMTRMIAIECEPFLEKLENAELTLFTFSKEIGKFTYNYFLMAKCERLKD